MSRRKKPGLDGETLQSVISDAGVSGAQISERLGKNRSWCSKIVKGVVQLSLSDAIAICKELDVSTEVFGIEEGASAAPLLFNPEAMVAAARAKDISMRQLAKLIGVAVTNVYKWQHKGAQPTRSSVELLAETLEIPLSHLYVEDNSRPVATVPQFANNHVVSNSIRTRNDYDNTIFISMPKSVWERIGPAMQLAAGHEITPIPCGSLRGAADALQALLASPRR